MNHVCKERFAGSVVRRLPAHFIALALTFMAVVIPHALAAAFPDKPIKFVVGFGAGGPTDIVARVVAEHLTESLGKKVIVENKTGASGNIATQTVASADADGYTYLIGASPLAVNHSLFPDFPVKFGRDLVALAPIGVTTNVLVVNPSLGVRDLDGFVKLARARPNFVTYATLGKGSSSHLAGVAFDLRAGTKMVPVSYRGGGEAGKDLLGGHVHAWFATIPSVLDAVRAGQLTAIATTGPERASWLPDVPTISESGFAGFDVRLWVGVFASAGVPEERMRVLEQAIDRVMSSKEIQRTLDSQGVAPFSLRRDEFSSFVALEIDRWRTVLGAMN